MNVALTLVGVVAVVLSVAYLVVIVRSSAEDRVAQRERRGRGWLVMTVLTAAIGLVAAGFVFVAASGESNDLASVVLMTALSATIGIQLVQVLGARRSRLRRPALRSVDPVVQRSRSDRRVGRELGTEA